MIRVVVADDHTVVREGICRILEHTNDMTVVGQAGTGDDALKEVHASVPNVLLLDIDMPGPGVIALVKQIKAALPRLRVLVLSMHPEEHYAVRVIRAGAAGYMTKDYSAQQLTDAIRRVAQGRRYISESLAEHLALGLDLDGDKPLHETLSHREYEVLQLLSGGKSLKEIAAVLSVNPKTVSTYRARLLQKLGLETNAALIRYAMDHDVVP